MKRTVKLLVGKVKTTLRIDTGSDAVLGGNNLYEELCKDRPYKLYRPKCGLVTADGSPIELRGYIKVLISSLDQSKSAKTKMYISKQDISIPLLSEELCTALQLIQYSPEVNNVMKTEDRFKNLPRSLIDKILVVEKKHSNLFNRPGCYKDGKYLAHVPVDNKNLIRHLHRPRPLPIKMKSLVKQELEKMLKEGKIEKVRPPMVIRFQHPLHCMLKKNGKNVRIVLDSTKMKPFLHRTANVAPPRVETFIEVLKNKKYYASLDLSNAYTQVKIDEESREVCTFTCEFGTYRYVTLAAGMVSSGDQFNYIVHELFANETYLACNVDDLAFGELKEDAFIEKLDRVLDILEKSGLALNVHKLVYSTELTYFGQVFTEHGYKPHPKRVSIIQSASPPKNKKGLVSFLSLLNYDSRFISNLSQKTGMLRDMCNRHKSSNAVLEWTPKTIEAFNMLKKELSYKTLNSYIQEDLPIYIYSDFGPVMFELICNEKGEKQKLLRSKGAYGCALLQKRKDNQFNLIHCYSRRVPDTQSHISQIIGESHAMVLGLKVFSYYYKGSTLPVTCVVDSKALVQLHSKPISDRAPPAIVQDMLSVQGINYKVEFVRSEQNLSDFLSRAALMTQKNDDLPEDAFDEGVETIVCGAVNVNDDVIDSIVTVSEHDPEIACLKERIELNDWDFHKKNPLIRTHYANRHNFNMINNLLYFDSRIFVPKDIRRKLCKTIHVAGQHMAVESTVHLLRQMYFIPSVYTIVRDIYDSCKICQKLSKTCRNEPLSFNYYPEKVLDEISIDYKSVSYGKTYLYCVIVDTKSRFPFVFPCKSTSFKELETLLMDFFSTYSTVLRLRSDSGPPFSSHNFKDFCATYGITHDFSIPLKPSTNGICESHMRLISRGVEIAKEMGLSDHWPVVRQIFHVKRLIPHTLTGVSPFKLFFNREPNLGHLLPRGYVRPEEEMRMTADNKFRRHVVNKQIEQTNKLNENRRNVHEHSFEVGENVLGNVKPGERPSTEYKILDINGPELTVQDVETGRTYRRHSTHFRKYIIDNNSIVNEDDENAEETEETAIPVELDPNLDVAELGRHQDQREDEAKYPLMRGWGNEDLERKGRNQRPGYQSTNDETVDHPVEDRSVDRGTERLRRRFNETTVRALEEEDRSKTNNNGPRRITRSMGPVPDIGLPQTAIENSKKIQAEMRNVHNLN